MNTALTEADVVGVVGAGAMGAGIPQVAALAGHVVHLYDTRPGAAQAAIVAIRMQLQTLRPKSRISASRHFLHSVLRTCFVRPEHYR
jgi:3-hydroxybutyryl-CoA dehydrogenase